jgi:hypothetical protein
MRKLQKNKFCASFQFYFLFVFLFLVRGILTDIDGSTLLDFCTYLLGSNAPELYVALLLNFLTLHAGTCWTLVDQMAGWGFKRLWWIGLLL